MDILLVDVDNVGNNVVDVDSLGDADNPGGTGHSRGDKKKRRREEQIT